MIVYKVVDQQGGFLSYYVSLPTGLYYAYESLNWTTSKYASLETLGLLTKSTDSGVVRVPLEECSEEVQMSIYELVLSQ